MRPLKLTIQAFGAYLDKIEIPFEKLGESNLFLISGSTGSGKTTIFDAICFALFNNSCGSYRGNNSLRSDYAKDDVKSFVEFDFFFQGENYRIIRTPQYQRKKLKGTGLIKENATAQINLPNGRIVYGVSEVDKFVIELLGVNLAQFSQIALLAQGEFLKLLNSTTTQRNEIFRTIFNTNSFLNLQEKLKEKFIEFKNKNTIIKQSIIQYITQIKTQDSDSIELINFIKENETLGQLKELIDKLEKSNNRNDEELDKYQKKLDILKKEKEANSILYQKILNKSQLLKNKLKIQDEIKIEKINFEKIKEQYSTLESKNKEIISLEKEIEKLKSNAQKAAEIISYKKEYDNKNKELENLDKSIRIINEKIQILNFDYLDSEYNKLKEFAQELSNNQEKLNIKKQQYNTNNSLYNNKYNIYLSNQAGILAKTLQDNSPCPVCGSLEHPNPAIILEEEINKETLDKLKKELDSKANNLNEISLYCCSLKEKIKAQEKKIDDYILNNLNDNQQKTYKTKQKTIIAKQNLDKDYQKEIKAKQEELESLTKAKEELKLSIVSIQTQINTLESQIRFKNKTPNPTEIIKEYQALNSKLDNLAKTVKEITKDYQESNLKLTSLNSNNELLDKQLVQLSDVDVLRIKDIEEKLNNIDYEINENSKKTKELNLIKGINDDIYCNLNARYKEFLDNEQYYNSYKLLSDCATGNLKGKQKISFEQYIQGYYLDLVLIEANKILKILTKNQFKFLRSENQTSTQNKTSLDIEILDFYTFKKRSSKTLSGGESFLASLSLALGLSSTVSSLSGAKNIDTLFIDEGFGSLDSDSLDKAINTIIDQCASNRLIGIISHIEELKNNIANQIKTTKTENGSRVEVCF